jgi:hypothetical protein
VSPIPGADVAGAGLVGFIRRLPFLVERHDDNRSAVPLHTTRMLDELRLALPQRKRWCHTHTLHAVQCTS